MSQQPSLLQQHAGPFLNYVQYAHDGTASQVEVQGQYASQYQLSFHPTLFPFPGAIAYQSHPQFTNDSATSYPSFLQENHQQLAVPLVAPPPSFLIPVPTLHSATTESSPLFPLNTPASTSPTGATNPDACRRSLPHFNKQIQKWSCGGCNNTFCSKSVAERHIATVGVKVTCRYCGSRVSTLEYSRRRHLQRETCKSKALERGISIRNEEDAFF